MGYYELYFLQEYRGRTDLAFNIIKLYFGHWIGIK
jgi:hypothetical protein